MIDTRYFHFERMPLWCIWRLKHYWFTVRVGYLGLSVWIGSRMYNRSVQFDLRWRGETILETKPASQEEIDRMIYGR